MLKKAKKIGLALMGISIIAIIFMAWPSSNDDNTGNITPASGTAEVTGFNYVGTANGFYTISDDVRTKVDRPYNTCVRSYPSTGIMSIPGETSNFGYFLSTGGVQNVEIKTLSAGETWHSYTC